MNEAEKKLKVLYTILQGYETINPRIFTQGLLELRDHIFYIHWLIEYCLDLLIALKAAPLIEDSNSVEEGEQRALIHVNVIRLLMDVTFSRKIVVAIEFEAIATDIEPHLRYIEKVRNIFAHPTNPSLEPYKDIHKQIEVATKLRETYDSFHEIMKKTGYFTLPK